MISKLLKPVALFAFMSGTAHCTTLGKHSTSGSAPHAEWSTCVPDPPSFPETPTTPYPRTQDYSWMSRNEWCGRVQAIRNDPARAEAQLAFMGDSITQGWPMELLNERLSAYRPIRLGIGGDRTQNLLWRVDHGELKGLSLRALILLIGTNNLGAGDTPEQTVQGIQRTIESIRSEQPQARIILMAILPREEQPTDPLRLRVQETNQRLAVSAKEWNVDFLDIGPQLLQKDGTISRDIMGDFVHLTPQGYRIWVDAVVATLQ